MPYDGGNYQDTVARRMLKVLGENGEHWIKGEMDDGRGNFCWTGAWCCVCDDIRRTDVGMTSFALGEAAARKTVPSDNFINIPLWNDAPERTFDDIKRALEFYHRAELAGETVS